MKNNSSDQLFLEIVTIMVLIGVIGVSAYRNQPNREMRFTGSQTTNLNTR